MFMFIFMGCNAPQAKRLRGQAHSILPHNQNPNAVLVLVLVILLYQQRGHAGYVCGAFLMGDGTMESCLHRVIETIGWRWGFVVLSYAWLAVLTVVQGTLIRLCCGRLRPVERGLATSAVMHNAWKSVLFLNVVLAPKVHIEAGTR